MVGILLGSLLLLGVVGLGAAFGRSKERRFDPFVSLWRRTARRLGLRYSGGWPPYWYVEPRIHGLFEGCEVEVRLRSGVGSAQPTTSYTVQRRAGPGRVLIPANLVLRQEAVGAASAKEVQIGDDTFDPVVRLEGDEGLLRAVLD